FKNRSHFTRVGPVSGAEEVTGSVHDQLKRPPTFLLAAVPYDRFRPFTRAIRRQFVDCTAGIISVIVGTHVAAARIQLSEKVSGRIPNQRIGPELASRKLMDRLRRPSSPRSGREFIDSPRSQAAISVYPVKISRAVRDQRAGRRIAHVTTGRETEEDLFR